MKTQQYQIAAALTPKLSQESQVMNFVNFVVRD